jgi:hypothetical protein
VGEPVTVRRPLRRRRHACRLDFGHRQRLERVGPGVYFMNSLYSATNG